MAAALMLGAMLGWLAGSLVRSDNLPFFVALGALAGLLAGLTWARIARPPVLGTLALLALLLIVILLTPPGVRVEVLAPAPDAAPAFPLDGLTRAQVATLASLQKVSDYPLYTMHYAGNSDISKTRKDSEVPQVPAAGGSWACSLFAALGDPAGRLYGRNFDWRFSPALLLFTDRPGTGGYASVSMVDIAYLGFDDASVDLTMLPLAERRALLEAPSWPFDGLNEAGVAVGMAAVPQADARHDREKPTLDSLEIMREILDHAGSTGEAVAILSSYNIDWGGGPYLHYLVADRSGHAALVEYHAGQIEVLPNDHAWHAATNFTRSAVAGDAAGQCPRYDALTHQLSATGGRLDSGAALDLLNSVSQTETLTQWSVVYDMSVRRVHVVMGRQFGRVHAFQLNTTRQLLLQRPETIDTTIAQAR